MFGFATKPNLLLSEIYITQRHKVAYYIFEKTNLAIKEIEIIKFTLIKNPILKCLYFIAFSVKILVSIFGDSSYVSFACVAFVARETILWGDCVVNSDRAIVRDFCQNTCRAYGYDFCISFYAGENLMVAKDRISIINKMQIARIFVSLTRKYLKYLLQYPRQ